MSSLPSGNGSAPRPGRGDASEIGTDFDGHTSHGSSLSRNHVDAAAQTTVPPRKVTVGDTSESALDKNSSEVFSEADGGKAPPEPNTAPPSASPRRAGVNMSPVPPPFTTVQSDYLLGLLKYAFGQYAAPQFSDDYEKLLPEDEYGEEAGPNARVWRAYEQEATAYDAAMIGQSRDGLDVMLVFAGLFSAVVTSFLVQVSQNLQPNYSEMTALLLHDLVVTQIQAGNVSAANITTPSADPSAFAPDTLDVWVNGLWLVSLTASLVVALSAVLAKQWLHHYTSPLSGTPGLRSHIRQFRFDGFRKWHVEAIIGTLPIIMHSSLGLFFAGLILFYFPLHLSLACIIIIISSSVLGLYIASNMLPLFYPQCPYQTPFTDFFPYLINVPTSVWRKLIRSPLVRKAISLFTSSPLPRTFCSLRVVKTVLGRASPLPDEERPSEPKFLMTTREREARAAKTCYDVISVNALDWVFRMTSNPTLHNIVVHAIAGLPSSAHEHARALWKDDLALRERRMTLLQCLSRGPSSCRPGGEVEMERLCRSILALPHPDNSLSLRMPHTFLEFPRLAASALLVYISRVRRTVDRRLSATVPTTPVTETKLVFLAIQHVPIHFMLWKALVSDALDMAIKTDIGLLWSELLPVVLFNSDSFAVAEPEGQIMTLSQAVRSSELRPCIFGILHKIPILQHFDLVSSYDFSVELRVVISMWKLAVHRLAEPNRKDLARYYEVLWYSMSRISALQLPDIPLLVELIESVVASPFFADEDLGTAVVENNYSCMQALLRHYKEVASVDETFSYPSFGRVIRGGMRYMLSGPNAIILPTIFPMVLTVNIMEEALKHGHDEAYRVFIERDWLKVAYEVPTTNMRSECGGLLQAFITGMDFLPAGDHRMEYVAFLLQPRNLTIACVSLLLMYQDRYVPPLHALNPTHPSWNEVFSTLSAVRYWTHHAHDAVPPIFPLNGFVGEKILQISDRSVSSSLDDTIRDMLRRNSHQIGIFLNVLKTLSSFESASFEELPSTT